MSQGLIAQQLPFTRRRQTSSPDQVKATVLAARCQPGYRMDYCLDPLYNNVTALVSLIIWSHCITLYYLLVYLPSSALAPRVSVYRKSRFLQLSLYIYPGFTSLLAQEC